MALLIDIASPEWITDEQFRDELRPLLPEADIRCVAAPGDLADVTALACTRLRPGFASSLPNLRLVQKLGAGVDAIVGAPDLAPGVQVARLKPDAPAQEIAEYCLAYVLREQRNMRLHEADQRDRRWRQTPPRETPATTVGVLGLGHIGGRAARLFAALEFKALGWARSSKNIDGVDCRHGEAALRPMLGECDFVVAILPSTPATRDLFDAELLAAMKPGAWLINAGRGDLVVEADLLAALDAGPMAGAVLDVVRTEPLPADSPLWRHPAVTITPHVSGWRLTGAMETVAENFRRLSTGAPMLNVVDRDAGY